MISKFNLHVLHISLYCMVLVRTITKLTQTPIIYNIQKNVYRDLFLISLEATIFKLLSRKLYKY